MEIKHLHNLGDHTFTQVRHTIPKLPGIYMLEFPNGLKYIGQSISLRGRIITYLQRGAGNRYLQSAIQKTGLDNIKVFLLKIYPDNIPLDSLKTLLNQQEDFFIRKYNTQYPFGYNLRVNEVLLKIKDNPYWGVEEWCVLDYKDNRVVAYTCLDLHQLLKITGISMRSVNLKETPKKENNNPEGIIKKYSLDEYREITIGREGYGGFRNYCILETPQYKNYITNKNKTI